MLSGPWPFRQLFADVVNHQSSEVVLWFLIESKPISPCEISSLESLVFDDTFGARPHACQDNIRIHESLTSPAYGTPKVQKSNMKVYLKHIPKRKQGAGDVLSGMSIAIFNIDSGHGPTTPPVL